MKKWGYRRGLKLGAVDYVIKDRPERLPFAFQRALDEATEKIALRKSEEAHKQSEENFYLSISESPLGIRIVAQDGKTKYANKSFLDIYEFSNLNEYTSTTAKERYTAESYLQHQERKRIRKNGSEISGYDLSIVRKNGEIRHIKVERKEILWNRTKHFQVINQDITEQIKLIRDLITAKEHAEESDRLKSAFLANISHEIRTPMNGILGFANLLKEPDLTGDEQQNYIRIIEKSGARMLNIINDIVDISKIESGLMKLDIKSSNINEQIEYIYTFFKPEVEAKGMKFLFKTTLPAQEATIQTDREKVFAILTNLVKNAIKYTNAGSIEFGYDLIETQCLASPESTKQTNTSLQFYVKDTGIGIPINRQEAIFDRFIQADIIDTMARQGAGLGLSISKSFVEMLGGKIWVESQVGVGSTFYFTLPYSFEPEEKVIVKTPVLDEAAISSTKKLKILIAEDDEVSEMLLDKTIKIFGSKVLKVKTGIDAVETCRKNPDLDLILMDIRMPHMGGYEAASLIREFNKEVIIIAQTAYGLSGDREKSIAAGCNDYIAKPIVKTELLALIQMYFAK